MASVALIRLAFLLFFSTERHRLCIWPNSVSSESFSFSGSACRQPEKGLQRSTLAKTLHHCKGCSSKVILVQTSWAGMLPMSGIMGSMAEMAARLSV